MSFRLLLSLFFFSLLSLVHNLQNIFADDFPKPYDTQDLTEKLLTPQEALEAIELPDGFRASLFAAEPDVRQPIAMTFDERGRLWVVENYTYAESEVNFETKNLRDRILIFEDADNDGKFDRRKIFWDQGIKATSVEIGFGGAWVLAAPNLLFIADRDRNDIPDGEPVVVLNGWDDGAVRHNIVNGLRWGPDGWLYGRHGILAASLVGTPETSPEHRTQIDCGIWRYHPTKKDFEVVARGTTNSWGMDWNAEGQMFFINTVIGHLWHVVPGAYYQRMYGEHFDPHVYQLLPQTADHYHWDIAQESWNETKVIGVTTRTDQLGGGHAHSGMMIYSGGLWPREFHGSLFTCNFHGRRLNVDRLERHGATYIGKHSPDFLKTEDSWFRGIDLTYGPDGNVFLLDWSDIGECHENDGVHRRSGRIFKITHGESKKHVQQDLARSPDRELVLLLKHENEWYARQARRLLQERAIVGQLSSGTRQLLFTLYDSSYESTHKLRAMWALYAIEAVGESWLLEQLKQGNEHLRVWAIQLLSDHGTISIKTRQVFSRLAEQESSGLVLTYLASALNRIPPRYRWQTATNLAARDDFADDPFFPLYVWYGIEPAIAEFPLLAAELAGKSRLPILRRHIARRLTDELERQPQGAEELLRLMIEKQDSQLHQDVLHGMYDATRGWRKASAPHGWDELEPRLRKSIYPKLSELARELSLVFGSGRAIADLQAIVLDKKISLDVRRAAIRSLVEARVEGIAPVLQEMLKDKLLSVEAIRGLAAYDHKKTPQLLLARYPSFLQPARQEAIITLASRKEYIHQLLMAVKTGRIPREDVSPFQLRQMQLFADANINSSISILWPELKEISKEKKDRIKSIRSDLTDEALAKADLSAGRTVFQRQCANCHTLFGVGEKVGPDLTGAQRHNLDYLLENIVDPSATVSKNYQMTIALTESGRVINGILVAKNSRTMTFRTTNGKMVFTVDEIVQLRDSDLSIMPDQQLALMSKTQVRDLIAYLMSPSQVPLLRTPNSE